MFATSVWGRGAILVKAYEVNAGIGVIACR